MSNPIDDAVRGPANGSPRGSGKTASARTESGRPFAQQSQSQLQPESHPQPGKDASSAAGRDPGRLGPLGLALCAVAIAFVVAAGLLGASVAEPALPGRRISPPFAFAANPSGWLVTILLDASVVLGALGLGLVWKALRDGWTPPPRALVRGSYAAAIAVVCVPPMGSADHLVYAAYGRLVTTGGNPYLDTAKTLVSRHDPIGLAVQPPWTDTSSVYGPVGTAEQALASWIGGSSVHTTVFALALLGALAFIGMGALLRRMGDPVRVTLLFSLNPILLFEAVNAAHLDAFAALFAVAGLYALHKRRDRAGAAIAGVLIGLGCATKLSLGLAVLAGLWGLWVSGTQMSKSGREPGSALQWVRGLWSGRQNWARSLVFVAAAAVAGILAYLPYGSQALTPASNSSQMISLGSAWRPLLAPLQHAFGDAAARNIISALGWALMLLLVWLLAPVVRLSGPDSGREPSPGVVAARALALLGLAWVLAAPYTLPWYDVLAWAPLVVCAAGPVDLLALARLAILSMAYVPGLDISLPPGVTGWANWVRADAAPVFSIAAIAWCAVLGIRRRRAARPIR